MTEDENYLFDLNGYLILEQVLTSEELELANGAVDRHLDLRTDTPENDLRAHESKVLKGDFPRVDLVEPYNWVAPWCLPFRKMLAHPTIVPYLNVILGKGFRQDHRMMVITMDRGSEGHRLHGSSGPEFNPNEYYIYRDGRMHNGLTVVIFQLADVKPDDGGFVLIPGSHKGNLPCPRELRMYEKYQDQVRHITCRAGDAVIFTEAVTHGALPWKADHQRRTVLTRYTAGNLSYMPALPIPEWADERTRKILEPAYHSRLDRPVLEE